MAHDGDRGLHMRAVSKRFAALTVLNDVSFAVLPGEIHGLIGPNGAGKTTAVNIATGFYPPTRGSVLLNGIDVTRMPIHERAAMGLGRSFQGARLFDKLDVRTNIRLSIEQRAKCARTHHDAKRVRDQVDDVLAEAGLDSVAATLAGYLPYGMRKQVEVARSCAFATSVLLLDEPTSGLSADDIARVLALVTSHRARLGILVIEHDMDVIMSLCDRITVIDAGNWLMTGTPAEVRRNPDVIAAYLGTEA
jgi:branched-chain amino acid transport system ATP-binding protein